MVSSRLSWVRFRRNRPAMVSLLLLMLVAVAAALGPYLLPATDANVSQASFLPPSQDHPFGTDWNGRDLLYRVLLGAQISLLVGFAGAAVSFAIGTTYVMLAGYLGGSVDSSRMRLVDVLCAIPPLIFLRQWTSA